MELQSGIDFHRDHAAAIIPILEKEALLEDDPVSAAHELQKIKVQL
jgi:hypothetical protein